MVAHSLRHILTSIVAFAAGVALSAAWAQDQDQDQDEFDELRVLIEINATDGDAGFQALLDGEGWDEVTIRDPEGEKLYTVKGFGSIGEQGLAENFFESAEPSCDEVPLAEFLDRFPAGEYVFSGKTGEGGVLDGQAVLTHDLPRAPVNLTPTGDGIDAGNPVTISWTAGSDLGNCPPDDAPIGEPELFGYEVVVEREDPEPLVVFSAEVPPDATGVTIPPEFLLADAIYKYEVIAIEQQGDEETGVTKGNQTISEDFFCTFMATLEDPCELPE